VAESSVDGPAPARTLEGAGAIVTGGASGLGAASARALVARGARVALVDVNAEQTERTAGGLGDSAVALTADVTDEDAVSKAVEAARQQIGNLRVAVLCAGVGWAERVVARHGPAQMEFFQKVMQVNVIGTYNVLRLTAAAMAENEPDEDGARGAVVMTASVAAFDGQIGQTAYSASKGAIVSLTLPAARDLSRFGIRVNTIAPGVFDTPLLGALPEETRDSLAAGIPFPSRLGQPDDFALLACQLVENPYVNGETIRLDGALRMAPK
jgi:NAD(P)-dependent dehydrogenase (short-subunit alcohol dehydrogenase family)